MSVGADPGGGLDRSSPVDLERRHRGAAAEEWLFVVGPFGPVGDIGGLVSGYRIVGSVAWYWAALVRRHRPLLVVSDWAVPPRPDPLLVKSAGLWAEHVCDAPLEQWTIANETYAVALDDPDDAFGRAYGVPTPISWDLEWYATGAAAPHAGAAAGYEQAGVVHGRIDLGRSEAPIELTEIPSRRWHRWGAALAPVPLTPAFAHDGLRAPFRFPDGTAADWVLTPDGWRAR